MAQADAVQTALQAIQAGEAQVLNDSLNALYVQAATEQKASDGTLTQADLDAAVKAAVDPLNAQIATLTAQDQSDIAAGQAAVADAQKQGADALAALQTQFNTLSAKEGQEAGVISGLQGALSQLQSVVSILQGLQVPVVPAST